MKWEYYLSFFFSIWDDLFYEQPDFKERESIVSFFTMGKEGAEQLSFRGWQWLHEGCPLVLEYWSLWILPVTNPNKRIGSQQELLWELPLQPRAADSKLTGKAANRWWERLLRNKLCWNQEWRAISRAANGSPGQREEPATDIASRKHPPRVAVRAGLFANGALSGHERCEQEHLLLAAARAVTEASWLPWDRAQGWLCSRITILLLRFAWVWIKTHE